MRILFLCLGNICRSPLAEGAARAAFAKAGIDATLDSAGTGDWHAGDPPDPRAQVEAARYGLDLSDLRARQVTVADFDRFDHIVAMDADNLAKLRSIAPPRARATLSLMLDHAGRAGQSVADPYFGGATGFAVTWDNVTAAAEGLLDRLSATA